MNGVHFSGFYGRYVSPLFHRQAREGELPRPVQDRYANRLSIDRFETRASNASSAPTVQTDSREAQEYVTSVSERRETFRARWNALAGNVTRVGHLVISEFAKGTLAMGTGQFVGVTGTQALLNHVAGKYGEDSEVARNLLQYMSYGVGVMHAVYAAYVTYGHMLRTQKDPSQVKATSVLAAGGAGATAFALSGLPKLLGKLGGGAHATKLAAEVVAGVPQQIAIETVFQLVRGLPSVKRAPTGTSSIVDAGTRSTSQVLCQVLPEWALVKSFGNEYLGKKGGKVFPQAKFMAPAGAGKIVENSMAEGFTVTFEALGKLLTNPDAQIDGPDEMKKWVYAWAAAQRDAGRPLNADGTINKEVEAKFLTYLRNSGVAVADRALTRSLYNTLTNVVPWQVAMVLRPEMRPVLEVVAPTVVAVCNGFRTWINRTLRDEGYLRAARAKQLDLPLQTQPLTIVVHQAEGESKEKSRDDDASSGNSEKSLSLRTAKAFPKREPNVKTEVAPADEKVVNKFAQPQTKERSPKSSAEWDRIDVVKDDLRPDSGVRKSLEEPQRSINVAHDEVRPLESTTTTRKERSRFATSRSLFQVVSRKKRSELSNARQKEEPQREKDKSRMEPEAVRESTPTRSDSRTRPGSAIFEQMRRDPNSIYYDPNLLPIPDSDSDSGSGAYVDPATLDLEPKNPFDLSLKRVTTKTPTESVSDRMRGQASSVVRGMHKLHKTFNKLTGRPLPASIKPTAPREEIAL